MIGEALARNLGVKLGDALIILGTAKNGGIAAHAATIVGIFRSGSTELDRTEVQIPIGDFREAWSMGVEEAHAVVGVSTALLDSEEGIQIARNDPGEGVDLNHLAWQDL